MVFQGSTYTSSQSFFDDTGEQIDPESITITVIDPNKNTILTGQSATKDSTGNYHYNYLFSTSAAIGEWKIRWNVTFLDESISFEDSVQVDNKALLTVSEVRAEAGSRGEDLSSYTDSQIEKKILVAQAEIEEGSSRYFTETVKEETKFKQKGNSILLNNHPIKSVELLKIDGAEINVTEDMVNKKAGIIYLTNYGLNLEYMAYIKYTAGETEGNSFLKASDICMDLFFINLNKSSDGKYIKSEKDSNYSVTYGDEDPQSVKENLIAQLVRSSVDSI